MSSWYPYRWVCSSCRAVHYFEARECCGCGGSRIRRAVNNQAAVDALKRTKKKRVTKPKTPSVAEVDEDEEDDFDEDQGTQDLKSSPVENDDAMPGTSGETTVRQPESQVGNDLDDMISNILEG